MERLKRIDEFEKLAYGLFIHWGLYSLLSQGEWTLNQHKIPPSEYEGLAKTFTAEHFDGRALARLAKESGMRYVTLTTRHHDGFSLYDTCGLTDYDAPHSGAKRDLVAEFVEGCRAEGIVPFFYHTTLDWRHPSFRDDFSGYLEYLRASVELLCKNYGRIGGFWFDGNWSRRGEDWQEDKLYAIIRRYQPEAIIVNNTGIGHCGELGHPEIDSVTYEHGRPTARIFAEGQKYVAGEMCTTMNSHWGEAWCDFTYKSAKELIENLAACRRHRANYLLNVGLSGDGSVPALEREMLGVIRRWIDLCGDSIYEGMPCGVDGEGVDFGLEYKGELRLFVHNLHKKGSKNVVTADGHEGPRIFTGVKGKAVRASWLDSEERLDFMQDGDKLTLYCTGYPYGRNTAVRVARIEFEEDFT